MLPEMIKGDLKIENHTNSTHENEGNGDSFVRGGSKTNTSDSQGIIIMA